MSLIEKIESLNNADLSGLMDRLNRLREAFQEELGSATAAPLTEQDLADASRQSGLTPEQFIEALETAQRRGMI